MSLPALIARASLCILFGAFTSAACATTFTVTRHDDPSPNGCAANDCSLREAILAANAQNGLDTVVLGTGSYGLPGGSLVFTGVGQLTLTGQGSEQTQIEGDGLNAVLVANTTSALYMKNLTLEGHGANALSANADGLNLLHDIRIADADSAIRVLGGDADSNGTMRIEGSEIHAFIDCGNVGSCTLIDSQALRLHSGGHTVLDIEGSVIDGDLATTSDSGLLLGSNGDTDIVITTIRHTTLGVSISAGAPDAIRIQRLQYIENDAPIHLSTGADLTIADSLFRANRSADESPAALHVDDPDAECTVTGSTFVDNVGNGDIGGAAMVENTGYLSITNSTFSGNSFTTEAAAAHARGAAIGFRMSGPEVTHLHLKNVTIVGPAFSPIGVSGTGLGGTGHGSFLTLIVNDSILRASCAVEADAIFSPFHNIESGGNSCGFPIDQDNLVNVTATALALGTLGDHGGPTPTYEPAAGSVAIDAGSSGDLCADFDQRGYPRPYGARCDIGAVEVGDILFKDGFD